MLNETEKPHFLSLAKSDWTALLKSWGEPMFRSGQIFQWIYEHHQFNPDFMLNLSQNLRAKLKENLIWDLPTISERNDSQDGSTKLLLKSSKGQAIESVLMRYEERTSLCVSSQVGCRLACSFCQTGKLGFMSHLSTAEILGQFAVALNLLKLENNNRRLSHVVFMGMGEPLDNYQSAVSAANRMIGEDGFGLSQRNVTLSTSGIAPKIISLATDSKASLAVSLHAARDDLRTSLMPINKKFPLAALKNALLEYQKLTGKIITLEYIMIKDVNVSLREAKDLVRFIHGMRAKVNLIPFNAHPGLPYLRPEDDEIKTFQSYLTARSIPSPVRYSKGLDVSAACGQLAAKSATFLHEAPARANLKILQEV